MTSKVLPAGIFTSDIIQAVLKSADLAALRAVLGGELAPTLYEFGAKGDGVSDDSNAFTAMEAWLNGGYNRRAVIPAGTYKNSYEVALTATGAHIYMLPGCVIKQQVQNQSVFQLRGDYQKVMGPGYIYFDGDRVLVPDLSTNKYEGGPARNRGAVVYIANANHCEVAGYRVDNYDIAAFFRGDTSDDLTRNVGNYVHDLTAEGSDQAVLAEQQDYFIIERIRSKDVTDVQGQPPHCVYVSGDADQPNGHIIVRDCYDENNIHDSGFKFKNCAFLDISGIHSTSATILANISYSSGFLRCFSLRDQAVLGDPNTYQAVNLLGCSKFGVSDGYIEARPRYTDTDGVTIVTQELLYGVRLSGSPDCVVKNVVYVADCDNNGSSPFSVEQYTPDGTFSHNARFIDCSYFNRGADRLREMVQIDNANNCMIVNPVLKGCTRVAAITGNSSNIVAEISQRLCQDGLDLTYSGTEPLWFRNAGTGTNNAYRFLADVVPKTFTDADTSPDISLAKYWVCPTPAVSYNITRWDGAQIGQEFIVRGYPGVIIKNNSSIILKAAADWSPASANEVKRFIRISTTVCVEM